MTETKKEITEDIQKYFDQLQAFQRSRPDLPQGEITRLSSRDIKRIVQAKEIAEAEAEGDLELVEAIKRYHKTGYIKIGRIRTPKRRK